MKTEIPSDSGAPAQKQQRLEKLFLFSATPPFHELCVGWKTSQLSIGKVEMQKPFMLLLFFQDLASPLLQIFGDKFR